MESLLKQNFVLQSIIDHMHYLIATTDLELRVTSFNRSFSDAFKSLFGRELKIGMCLHDITNTPEGARFVSLWTRATQGEKFSFLEEHPKEVVQEVEYSPLYDPDGKLIGAIHVGRTINEIWDKGEVQEVELDEDEKELYWPHNVEFGRGKHGESIDRQASWEHYTGQSADIYAEQGWLSAYHPAYQSRIAGIWKKVATCKRPQAFSLLTMLWNDEMKGYRHTLVHATPHFDTNGCISYWSCAGLDMHDLMNTQYNLLRTTKRMNMILEVAHMGTWEWNRTRDHLVMDKKVLELFGLPGDSPVNSFKELSRYVVDQSLIDRALQQSMEHNVPYDCEFEVVWPDGTHKWLAARGEYIRCEDTLVGIDYDITPRKQMEEERLRYLKHEEEIRTSKQAQEYERKRAEEAEENQRRQEDFIDTVCHEIRNPLMGISGGTGLAQEELSSLQQFIKEQRMLEVDKCCEKIKDHLDSILKCAEQQKVIVDDVLDLSKLQNNKIELSPIPFKLSVVINLVTQMFHSRAEEKNLYIHTHMPEDEQYLKADVHRLQQVIINLVSNAVKFTHNGGIVVSAEISGAHGSPTLTICVEDTGIGISAEEQPNLFSRFSQARNMCNRYGGSGLGLAISKRIVEAMGGKIWAESTQGVGSKFYFVVQVERATDHEIEILETIEDTPLDSEQPIEFTNCKILVVDDNGLNQKILASYLEKSGFGFHLANDGLEAMQLVQQYPIDLIFMDIEMPNMNGLEATRHIRLREKEQLLPRSAIIGLSGNARKEKIESAFEAGMDHFLTKPYHKMEILRAISKYAPKRDRRQSASQTHLLERMAKKLKTQ